MILCYYYQSQITKKIVATKRLASQLPKHKNTEWYDEWELIAKTFTWNSTTLTQFFPKRRIKND